MKIQALLRQVTRLDGRQRIRSSFSTKLCQSTDSHTGKVQGATHLFEELGALEEVARLARDWFKRYLEDGT